MRTSKRYFHRNANIIQVIMPNSFILHLMWQFHEYALIVYKNMISHLKIIYRSSRLYLLLVSLTYFPTLSLPTLRSAWQSRHMEMISILTRMILTSSSKNSLNRWKIKLKKWNKLKSWKWYFVEIHIKGLWTAEKK